MKTRSPKLACDSDVIVNFRDERSVMLGKNLLFSLFMQTSVAKVLLVYVSNVAERSVVVACEIRACLKRFNTNSVTGCI